MAGRRTEVHDQFDAQAILAAIVASSDDAIISKTLDGVILSWNAGAERIFGYSAAEAIGRSIMLIVPPDRHDEQRTTLDLLRRGERVVQFDTVRVCKDGRRIDMSLTVSPVRDTAGRIVAASKLARDVTGQRAVQAALLAKERQLQHVTDNAAVMVVQCSRDLRYVFVNKTVADFFGRPVEEIVGQSIPEILGQAAFETIRPYVERALAGERVEFEAEIPYAGPGKRYMRVVYVPDFAADGSVSGWVAAVTDLTDRKRMEEALRASEERFRLMANTTPAIIWTADPTGRITFHNRRWLDFTGLSQDENAQDWPNRVLHPDDLERCTRAWARALENGLDYEIEVRNRRHDGEYRWFLTRATPIRDAAGRIVEWYGSTTDIHDRKLAEEALRVADRRKDEFLATLAHELRNPLAPIRNSLHILRLAGNLDPGVDRVRETMERQVNHMVRLVDDLLEVSRISRGKIELRKKRVELAAVVRGAVETSQPLIDAGGHQLAVSIPSEPLTLKADPVRLAQVFANLLNNSAKYADGPGQIWLSARREDASVVVSVRDTGVGIPADMLPRVFEMFKQTDSTHRQSEGGLGIGLTIVQSLVELHGGTVTATSDGPGKGSEFVVRLPLADVRETAPRDPRPPDLGAFPLRVLVLDDNHDAADSLGMLLRYLGAEVHVVYDGPAALQAMHTFRPSVALLDIGMTGMDGLEVARRIREQPEFHDVLLVAVTGWGKKEDRRRSRAAGFDHHLVKPTDADAIQVLMASIASREGRAVTQ